MFAYGAIKIASIGSDQHAHTASIIVMIDTIPIMIFIFFVAFIMLMIFNKKKKIENNLDTDKDFK